jgi:hypothetical protein
VTDLQKHPPFIGSLRSGELHAGIIGTHWDYPVKTFHNDAHSVKCISLDERAHTHMRRSERRVNMRERLSQETVERLPCRCAVALPGRA